MEGGQLMRRNPATLDRRRRRSVVTSLSAIVFAIFTLGLSSPASAGVTSVTVSPATWTPGSSQAFTLTLQVSGSLTYVGFWDLNQPQTWTLSQTGSNAGTFDEATDTLTCATGVTYASALFNGWGNGAKGNICYDNQDSTYFEIGMNNTDVTGTGTVVISVPAGLLTAPSTVGTTVFQAIANPDPKLNFNAIVAEATPPAAEAENAPPSHIQAVGLPASGSCDAVEDADLGWGTGLSGGWIPSWGAWLNDGTGGPACMRTLAYDPARSRWVSR
jgi:hypothetical protein